MIGFEKQIRTQLLLRTICLAVTLALFSCASAQEKQFGKQEFKAILTNAAKRLQNRTYRLTKTVETFADRDANSQSVETKVLEVVAPDKFREVEQFKSETRNDKSERIHDGKNLYLRKNDGKWKKYNGGSGSGGGLSSGKIVTSYKFVGKTILNDQNANAYEVESTRTSVKFTQTATFEVQHIDKIKYWFNESGDHLQIVKESEIVGSKSLSREVIKYEYDLNIDIEAPEMIEDSK